jgi:chromate reductase, NAD(P)H dehydrogenase (quinone)
MKCCMENSTPYLIISGTNRKNAQTARVAHEVAEILSELGEPYQIFSLEDIDYTWLTNNMYDKDSRAEELDNIQSRLFIPTQKWIFIVPEYNGSFPGMLKAFLDILSVKWQKETFFMKKSLLIGVASGRAGNLRGLEHLTGILHYLKMVVFPVKQPISKVNTLTSESNIEQLDDETRKVLFSLLASFRDF